MSKDFCRIDYYNGTYETDTGETIIEYRNHKLMKNNYYYQRIKRLAELPKDKKVNTIYIKERN